MQLARPFFASDPKLFGKAPIPALSAPQVPHGRLGDDLKLFATTFVAGFVVVSILIA